MLERVKAEANQWVRQLGSDLKFALSQLARFLLGGVKLPRFIWHQVRRREIRKEVVHAALFLVVLHLAWAVLLVWKDGWAAAIFWWPAVGCCRHGLRRQWLQVFLVSTREAFGWWRC